MQKRPILLLCGILFAHTFFAEPGTISQADVLAKVGDHDLVRQARLGLELRESTLSSVSGWQGAQAALTPSARYDDKPGDMVLAETGIRADILFPLGTSPADREKRIAAREISDIARLDLEESFGKAYSELFRLYSSAYTAQENRKLAEVEAGYYRLRLDAVKGRASRGLESLSDVADTEAEYQAAAERVIQAGMDSRIAWFNLAYAAGLEVSRPGPGLAEGTTGANPGLAVLDLPVFRAPDLGFIVKELPQPGLLISSARSRTAAVLAQRQKLESARRGLESYTSLNLNVAPKILYAVPDASASLGYGTSSGALNLGLDWRPYVNPDSVVGNSTPPDNSLSISILVSGNINPRGADGRAALEAAVKLEESRLAALEQGIDLLVRNKYTAYLKARDSLAESERAARLAAEVADANRARQALGQLTPEDEAAQELLLARSANSVAKARSALGQAYLEALAASNAWDLAGIEPEGDKP